MIEISSESGRFSSETGSVGAGNAGNPPVTMHRLFVALRPPPPIRAALTTTMEGIAAARWQDDDQLHLTVRYIGPVERPLAEDIAGALAAVRAPAIDVRLAGVGRFAHRGVTEALWADVAPHDALASLHRKVDRALVGVGLAPERRAYRPHITLARFSRIAGTNPAIERWLACHAGLASAPFALAHLILYESHLGHDGARYEAVARWPLG